MKLYVDEMPKECLDCPCHRDGFCKIDYRSVYIQRPYSCPLQLLQDHDKEVRKQVCDEIRETADGLSYIDYDLDEKSVLFDTLKDILDQIEKGEE